MTAALGNCPVELGWAGVAQDYRALIREEQRPVVQGCNRCGEAYWPARLRCACGNAELQWFPAGETGRVVSTVGVDPAPGEGAIRGVPRRLLDRLPYTTVVVQPDDWPGLRIAMLADGLALQAPEIAATVVLSVEVSAESVILIARSTKG